MSDEEIDVEEIMQTIRDKLRKKKEIEMNLNCTDQSNVKIHTDRDEQKKDSKVWEHLLESAYIENNSYAISSHRKVMGSFLVKGRKLVQGEMQRYVDPVIWKQQEFNKNAVSFIRELYTQIPEYDNRLSSFYNIISNYDKKLEGYSKNLSDNNNKLNFCYKILSRQLEKYESELRCLRAQELDIQYFDFENRFRGTEDEIKKRINIYLRYFSSGIILDIGCGRGEFLEILRDAGINGKGIEINEQMYNHCKNKNLDVELNDAFVYLERQEDKSVDGIIMLQVIEHLNPNDIIEFLKLSYQKLKNGSYMILETVNIQNPGALSNFYVDPTHKWPVHPEFLKYIAESKGFIECEILYRLYQENAHQVELDQLKIIAPDYALICKKSGAE